MVHLLTLKSLEILQQLMSLSYSPVLPTILRVYNRPHRESCENSEAANEEIQASGNRLSFSTTRQAADWRNTWTEVVGCSPDFVDEGQERFFQNATATSLLKPLITPGVREKLLNKKERQTHYYNRGTRELSPLRKGDAVVMLYLVPKLESGRKYKSILE